MNIRQENLIDACSSSTQHLPQKYPTMTSPIPKDSDTFSSTSTITTTSTTDFAPKPTSKHNNFIALQTLLETPELATTTSSTTTSQTATETAAMIKKIRRRKIYFGIALTVFVCCSVLAAILVVILGPREWIKRR
jgi:hypothetical protein